MQQNGRVQTDWCDEVDDDERVKDGYNGRADGSNDVAQALESSKEAKDSESPKDLGKTEIKKWINVYYDLKRTSESKRFALKNFQLKLRTKKSLHRISHLQILGLADTCLHTQRLSPHESPNPPPTQSQADAPWAPWLEYWLGPVLPTQEVQLQSRTCACRSEGVWRGG